MLAFLLLLSDPRELLRALEDPEIDVRQAAVAELHRRGEELWDALVDARRNATDLEVRGRLDELLRRLRTEARIRRFQGGAPVEDLALSLKSERFHGSGPFRLTLEVMNVGSSERTFPGVGAWDVDAPGHEIRAHGAEARLTVKNVVRPNGLARVRRSAAAGIALPVRLRPGESTRYTYALDARELASGDYELRADVGELRSNAVRILIRK